MLRCDNLFRDLDSRALTAAEEDIIAQRVALQRRMLEEYEKRERARKVLLSWSTVSIVLHADAQHQLASAPVCVTDLAMRPLIASR